MKAKITLEEFIQLIDNVDLYYHGNSYKEVVNYNFLDERNNLKRLAAANAPRKKIIASINDILYYAAVLNIKKIANLKKQGLKQIII